MTASAATLTYRFAPEAYLGFVEEFDEEDLFSRLTRAQRGRVASRLLERLRALPHDDLVLRLPIVRATGVGPIAAGRRD